MKPAAALTVLLVVAAGVGGCGARGDADEPQRESRGAASSDRLERATPRGLAAGLLRHLPSDVVSMAGADDGALSVVVETTDPTVESVHVYVVPAEPDALRRECGSDHGYEVLSCVAGPSYVEVAERRNEARVQPSYMGRTVGDRRGDVLVQVWGARDPAAAVLVERILRDRLLGLQTTEALNAEGEALSDFGDLEVEVEVEDVPQ